MFWYGEKKTLEGGEKRRNSDHKLSLADQLFAVLVRLRLGLEGEDIADRLGMKPGNFSSLFNTWICLLDLELPKLNPFPSRSLVNQHMPSSFRHYPTTRIILDCTEVRVQSKMFSSYKHHTTYKILVGVSPGGVITYISEPWGGRVSDREIVRQSNLLELLEEGDNVMADRGFTIEDLLKEKGVTLNIPPFLTQRSQFSKEEVEETRKIASVRIHVERGTGRIKTFHILDGVMPLSLHPVFGKIFRVCALLTNFLPPLVPHVGKL